ncbi:2-methylaconitate cis-trans isomerase PrpF family protein [Salisediminibacterium beveridgei]|uniref:3-methylitaconate isomerase n=1 Tax=Salisediminibacterium beveridgei TaxID=632773 RepID=A0A1D7QS77_9BACI|nr:PrpF domain-containing protein [Salisediminibacterium beveridgei]AOM81843.1 3-methylitaconate isomerase [Salisediminibacterium beveridgei]
MQEEQIGIRCVYMRGGTSKGCYLLRKDLPEDQATMEKVILRMYGSPDDRQIDGLGGADPLTSKVAIIEPSTREDAEVEYTFGQVGINKQQISYGGNCGNMLSGVGPFAIDQGLVPISRPVTTVRIYNTNTDQIIHAEVPISGNGPAVAGDGIVSGVPGTGAVIKLNFLGCEGSMTGKLLPTGNVRDTVEVNGKSVEVSLVDAATPFVFVRGESIGMTGKELPEDLIANPEYMERLETIRSWAAVQTGSVEDAANATDASPNVPRVAFVTAPVDYETSEGQTIHAQDVTILARQMSMQKPHRTYAVTGSICTSAAAEIPGTVVNEAAIKRGETIVIGHPSGVIEVDAKVTLNGDNLSIDKVGVVRTARKIMEGTVFIPKETFNG